jgi:hypothetical protein
VTGVGGDALDELLGADVGLTDARPVGTAERPPCGARHPASKRQATRYRPSHTAGSATPIKLCITLWQRAKTVDQDERGNAERRALFVGLWPPMFWLIGDAIQRCADRPRRLPRR